MIWNLSILFRMFWSGFAASVSIILLATVAVEATPHIRGISFFPELRFAVLAPVCFFISIAAAFFYRVLVENYKGPRVILAAILLGLAVIVLLGIIFVGPSGLVEASILAIICISVSIALLIPRFADKPIRSRVAIVAILIFGIFECIGVIGAFKSEQTLAPGSQGLAFEIPRILFDVDHKFINLPSGARIHYVDEGEGEILLFLHGNPSWSFQWRDLIHGLKGSYRCIALDYPGFGLSEAAPGFGFTPKEESIVLEEFVDQLKLHNITLVMQDWGGPIGLGLAGRRPELVRQMILGSTWAWKTDTNVPRGIFSKIAGGPIGEFIQMNFNGFANLGIKNGIVRELPPDVLNIYTSPFRPLDRRGIAAFYPGQITAATEYFAEVEAGLPRLAKKKALIFWALQDQGFPRSDLERFEKTFPNHKTIELPLANHFFFEDSLDIMIPEMIGFLNSSQIKEK